MTEPEPTLSLWSESLLSKWGFQDGDTPEQVMDYCDDHGIDYVRVDWHEVLRGLVRKHLLPELEKHHTIKLVDIETIHNPIRASEVDGRDVEGDWYDGSTLELKPEGVHIPMSAVVSEMEAARD